MNIGLKIKQLMIKENIEIPVLAKKLGKSKQAIYDILEKEDVNTSLLKDLSSVFNVPITSFFDDSTVNQNSTGNSNVLVGRDNNGHITTPECQDQLEDALLEIKHLKDEVDGKDKLLHEKERLINVLMSQQSNNDVDLSIVVYSTTGSIKIDILQIVNIIPCTGKEKEFTDKINSGSGHEYPCCIICIRGENIFVLQDFAYIWSLIAGRLTIALK